MSRHSLTDTIPEAGPGPLLNQEPTGRLPEIRNRWDNRLLRWLRRHRGLTAMVVVLMLAAGITVANTLAAPQDGRALSANNPSRGGAQAVARILGDHGVNVRPADDFPAAVDALAGNPDATLFLYDDHTFLDRNQLQRLKELAGRIVVVAPSFTTLQALGPGLHQAGVVPDGTGLLQPGCSVEDPVAAGPITADGAYVYSGGTTCFGIGTGAGPAAGVVAYSGNLTVLGSAQLMSNGELAREGNAALAIRTLGATDTLVWYLPAIRDFDSPDAPKTLDELAPAWTGFLGPWLIVVAVLAMVWRGRRLGPLVFEPLPVTVKAGETAYGRARLYHEARALDLARDNLRAGTLVRLARHLRMGPDASAADVARRTEVLLDRPELSVLKLLDELPSNEARLVQWAQELHDLEQKVAER